MTDPTTGNAASGTDDDTLVRVEGLEKHFPVGTGLVSSLMRSIRGEEEDAVHAIDGISFDLREGETFGIAGESGCGKTTTGMCLTKLYEPTGGSIYYDDEDIADKSGSDLTNFRQNAQMIFQDPFESLNPRMTVYDTVVEPLRIHDVPNQRARVRRALEFAELEPAEAYFDRYPHELSGGQRQRLAIARALVIDPDFIVADEPVSMLDVSLRAGVLSLLERMTDEFGLSVVYISHDLSLLRHMCDRLAIMYMGKIVEQGPTEEIITNPKHPYTRALIDAVPVPDPLAGRERVELEGEVGDAINVPSGCRFRKRCQKLIQPSEYNLTDDEWTAVRTFMRAVQLHNIESRDEAEIRSEFFADVTLDGEAGNIVDEGLSLVSAGELDDADDLLTGRFEDESVCANALPPLHERTDIDGEREVACHRYESAEGFDPYAEIEEAKPEELTPSAESSAN
ncbi:ABC transporter ATP-binding protein [Haladaptatus caseinilyticus]|uniref:ABC transporter ATP-binding protein n=1 Tax=Haladaptatus caseinilyticus TaxID=2993314 RepID=UPI00224BA09A|nr:ABC transporter ATP-binding protein [Haladaptatus caseinilyticus]